MKTGALKRGVKAPRAANTGLGPSCATAGEYEVSDRQDSGGHVRGPFRNDVEAFGGNAEPTMVDVLNEPIVRTVMRRDGVAMDSLQAILSHAERSVSHRPKAQEHKAPGKTGSHAKSKDAPHIGD